MKRGRRARVRPGRNGIRAASVAALVVLVGVVPDGAAASPVAPAATSAGAPTRSCLAVVARRDAVATQLRLYRGARTTTDTLQAEVRTWTGRVVATAVLPPVAQAGWTAAPLSRRIGVRMSDRLSFCVQAPHGDLGYTTAPGSTALAGAGDLFGLRTTESVQTDGRWTTRVHRDRFLAIGVSLTLVRAIGPAPFAPMAPFGPRALNVLSFGAVGDGRHDDTAAIQRALSALRPGGTLVLPAGRTFRHTRVPARLAPLPGRGVLTVTTPGVRITGGGTLLATAPATAAFLVRADRVQLDHLTFRTTGVRARGSKPDHHGIHVDHRRGVRLWDLTVEGSHAAGIFLNGASDFQVRRVRVTRSHADGLHMTGGSRRGTVTDITVSRSGDDGVAVVSYRGEPITHHITVTRARVQRQTWGRGIAVAGGTAIRFQDVEIDRSSGAAIYLASEAEWRTQPVSRVVVDRAVVTNANLRGRSRRTPVHGAVLLYNSTGTTANRDIVLRRLTVVGPPTGSGRIVGVLGAFSRVTLRDATLRGKDTPVWTRGRPVSLRVTGTIWNGADGPARKGW